MTHSILKAVLLSATIGIAATGVAKAGLNTTAIAQSPLSVALIQVQAAANGLGDVSPFRIIANDTLKIVNAGDLTSAKTRIKDLEEAWDDAEGQMRPRDKDGWRRLDKAIDLVLQKLRTPTPDKAACADALLALIAAFDSTAKRT